MGVVACNNITQLGDRSFLTLGYIEWQACPLIEILTTTTQNQLRSETSQKSYKCKG